jgi:5-methylcytosine-specific restriction endonuclease McrA
VIAWQFWNAPSGEAPLLRRLQARRCGQTGTRLLRSAEVDHRIPLFRVWKEYRDAPWPKLLDFWGLPNLQVINRDAHAAKCAIEAAYRQSTRSLSLELE